VAKETAPVAATRTVTVPAPEDLEHAKDDALLQLRIGRSAHFYTVVVSAALALDAVLLLYFQPLIGSLAPGAWPDAFYLFLPIAAGVTVAAVGLASKWEEYMLWPWELHFSVSVGALAVNALVLVVFVGHVAGYATFASVAVWPGLYFAALAGISLAVVGLVLTWSGWSRSQWVSAIAGVLPVATALIVLFPPSGASSLDDALAVSLFLSAILYQTSGSFLHLISSGTRSHERELITSGQTKMFRLAEEVRDKEEALHFREIALVKREADAENDELSIKRQNDALTAARTQLEEHEEDYRKRSDAVVQKEREWAGKVADIEGRERQVEDKTKALELREQEVARNLPLISAREARVVEREGEMTKRDVELTQRQQELDRRATTATENEARLEARKKELDQKTNDLLRREGEVTARTSGTAIGVASPSPAKDLATRELKLQQLKAVLDEQNVVLGRKAKEAAERSSSADASLAAAAQKEAQLAARDAALRQREAELAEQLKATVERRAQYDAAARDYKDRMAAVNKSQVDAAQKSSDVERALKSVGDRESSVQEREQRLRAAIEEIETRESRVNERERALAANEAEVGLRRHARPRGAERSVEVAATKGAAEEPRRVLVAPIAGGGSSGVRDEANPPSPSSPGSETLRASPLRRLPDRQPSGTPRLDDLLLGGLPPKSHVVLVGDAFVGKEVVVYGFLAEGLRRGEPAVIVTAARPPGEIAESLGLVLPQFKEYEQMGLVTWIDASGSAPASPNGNRLVAKGSDDRAGILSLLVKTAKKAEEQKRVARVGFLGLSAVLAHGDERASFSFLQNVVGILKPRGGLAMYSLEGGALSDAQVETLLSRMDGAILFRQDRDKTFLSVKGLGDVQTRDWVECRATNRALIVGSFALERIR
jgi:KaiC/GvpD/RAD55 family RecA-like ATPase/uncharacterized protein (DUF3084 family)